MNRRLNSYYSEQLKLDLLDHMDGDFLSKMQKLDMKTYLVDDILTKVDRASMLNSLEARVPLLDHKLAELSFKIPSELKLKGNIKKYILKETVKNILPPEILSHKKQGFSVPLNSWFKGDLKDYANDVLLNSRHLNGFIQKGKVEQLLKNNQKGIRDYSDKIWSLVFLDEWLKQNND